MDYTLKKHQINKVIIRPLKEGGGDSKKPIKGAYLFKKKYPNILLLAPKESGKTLAIYYILKECIDKDTEIFIASSTIKWDKTTRATIDKLKKTNSVVESDPDAILDYIKDLEAREEGEEGEDKTDEPKPKPRKKKEIAPERVFIFDDISSHLRRQEIANEILKHNRHFKSMVIISTQGMKDINPTAFKQIQYILLFKRWTEEDLKHLYDKRAIHMPFNKFVKMYEEATKDQYIKDENGDDIWGTHNFLYCDFDDSEFRQNFHEKIDDI